MARKATVAEVILEAVAVAQGTGCSFEELIDACPALTWNQIFFEVDRLSREGRVQLSQARPAIYCVRLPKSSAVTKTGSGESLCDRNQPKTRGATPAVAAAVVGREQEDRERLALRVCRGSEPRRWAGS